MRVIPLASKIDGVLDRLETLTKEVAQLKRGVSASPLVPLPKPLKASLVRAQEVTDPLIIDTQFGIARDLASVVLPAASAREIVNNPMIGMDERGQIIDLSGTGTSSFTPAASMVTKPKRKPSKKQKQQRKIQSAAFKNANARARKKDGTLRKGYDQQRIALMAQRECTKERQRLGLCEMPKKKRKSKR